MTRSRLVRIDEPYDLGSTLRVLSRGARDPTTAVAGDETALALRTPDGPATVRFARVPSGVRVDAWGAGAAFALDEAPGVLGCDDDSRAYRPVHPLLRELHRRFAGIRFPKSRRILDHLIPSVLEQKVTGREALRSYRALVLLLGEPAPGPFGLIAPPDPAALAAVPYHALHPLGIEQRRADTLRRACARAGRLEEAVAMTPEDARRRLQAIAGIGPWTAAEVTRLSHGDPDAVSVGDFHLPSVVAFALAGEPRADDRRMLELLEPERPHRARAVRLMEAAGVRAPRFGPRRPLRDVARI